MLAAAIGIVAGAAELSCDRYAMFKRLPDSFKMIGSAILPRAELFILTDGACTCENTPAVDRKLGKSVPQDLNWRCRKAIPDERSNES